MFQHRIYIRQRQGEQDVPRTRSSRNNGMVLEVLVAWVPNSPYPLLHTVRNSCDVCYYAEKKHKTVAYDAEA